MKIRFEFDRNEEMSEDELAARLDNAYKYKYRLMWELRFLEPEILEENGIITLTESQSIEVAGFSETLTREIFRVFADTDWNNW
jgi:hypothetical protein